MTPDPGHRMRRLALPGLLLAFLMMAVVPRAVGAPAPTTPPLLGGDQHIQRVALTMPGGRACTHVVRTPQRSLPPVTS